MVYIAAVGVCDGLACVLMILGQRDVSSSRTGMLLSLESVFSAATGFLFLRERLSVVEIRGAALELAGPAYTNLDEEADEAVDKKEREVRVRAADVEIATERSLLQPRNA